MKKYIFDKFCRKYLTMKRSISWMESLNLVPQSDLEETSSLNEITRKSLMEDLIEDLINGYSQSDDKSLENEEDCKVLSSTSTDISSELYSEDSQRSGFDEIIWTNDGYESLSGIIKQLNTNPRGTILFKKIMSKAEYILKIYNMSHPSGWLYPSTESNKICKRTNVNLPIGSSLTTNNIFSLGIDNLIWENISTTIGSIEKPVISKHIWSILGHLLYMDVYHLLEMNHDGCLGSADLDHYKLSFLVDTVQQHLEYDRDVIVTAIGITNMIAYSQNNFLYGNVPSLDNCPELYLLCESVNISYIPSSTRRHFGQLISSNKFIYLRIMLVISSLIHEVFSNQDKYISTKMSLLHVKSMKDLIFFFNDPLFGQLITIISNQEIKINQTYYL